MTVWIDTSDRDSARILRFVASERACTSLEVAEALGLPPKRVASMMKNFANRGRLRAAGCLPTNGCPTVYVLTPEAETGLSQSAGKRRPRVVRKAYAPRSRAPRPRRLAGRTVFWCRAFLKAGWTPEETAGLFNLRPLDLQPLEDCG